MNHDTHLIAGRFVVKWSNQSAQGVSADEAAELVRNSGDDDVEVFIIHRVTPEGRLELAGIEPASLTQRDCMMFSHGNVVGARRDYDAFVTYSATSPPPCRVEMKFGHAKSFEPPHVVILIFPSACQTAMGGWLSDAPFDPGESVEASRHVLEAFEASSPQIVLQTTLEPAPRGPSGNRGD